MVDTKTKAKNNGHSQFHDPETAKILAQHLKNTPEDLMQETTYIPLKMIHVLSMLQALEGQFDKFLDNIENVNIWYKKQENPDYEPETIEDDEEVVKASHGLFIHRFRSALHQYFRGKDGLFLEKLVILADTDLQTRGSGNMDDIFKKPMREQ